MTTPDARPPENTTATAAEIPLGALITSSEPDGIEGQEAAGTTQLVASQYLPVDCDDDEALVELGFTFGEPLEADPLFRPATIPAGWAKRAIEARQVYLVDERGVDRVSVFYKAAFYDRRANMWLINVGRDQCVRAVYAHHDLELGTAAERPVELNANLTTDELEDVSAEAEAYLERAVDFPHIYDKRAHRARALIELVDTRLNGGGHG